MSETAWITHRLNPGLRGHEDDPVEREDCIYCVKKERDELRKIVLVCLKESEAHGGVLYSHSQKYFDRARKLVNRNE